MYSNKKLHLNVCNSKISNLMIISLQFSHSKSVYHQFIWGLGHALAVPLLITSSSPLWFQWELHCCNPNGMAETAAKTRPLTFSIHPVLVQQGPLALSISSGEKEKKRKQRDTEKGHILQKSGALCTGSHTWVGIHKYFGQCHTLPVSCSFARSLSVTGGQANTGGGKLSSVHYNSFKLFLLNPDLETASNQRGI